MHRCILLYIGGPATYHQCHFVMVMHNSTMHLFYPTSHSNNLLKRHTLIGESSGFISKRFSGFGKILRYFLKLRVAGFQDLSRLLPGILSGYSFEPGKPSECFPAPVQGQSTPLPSLFRLTSWPDSDSECTPGPQ